MDTAEYALKERSVHHKYLIAGITFNTEELPLSGRSDGRRQAFWCVRHCRVIRQQLIARQRTTEPDRDYIRLKPTSISIFISIIKYCTIPINQAVCVYNQYSGASQKPRLIGRLWRSKISGDGRSLSARLHCASPVILSAGVAASGLEVDGTGERVCSNII